MDFKAFIESFDKKGFNHLLGIRLVEWAPDYGRT